MSLKQRDYEAQSVQFKRSSNATCPVMRLPNELLAHIFEIYLANWRLGFPDEVTGIGHLPRAYYNWVRITHVCYHWRMVALSTATLWTRIPVCSPNGVSSFVKRSGGALLKVSGVITQATDVGKLCELAWSPVCAQSRRFLSLHVTIQHPFALLLLSRILWSPRNRFTNLRCLALHGYCAHQGALESEALVVQRRLTGQAFPLLQFLSIRKYSWSVIHKILRASPSLRSLSLGDFNFRSVGWKPVLDTLATLLNLQSLEIFGDFPDDVTEPKRFYGPVVLPDLRTLTVAPSNAGMCGASFISCLRIPPPLGIHVTCKVLSQTELSIEGHALTAELDRVLAGYKALGQAQTLFRTLCVRQVPSSVAGVPSEPQVLGWHSALSVHESPPTTDFPATTPQFSLRLHGFPVGDMIGYVTNLRSFRFVETLYCDSVSILPNDLELGFSCMINISSVWASKQAVHNVLEAIMPPTNETSVSLPNLKTLHVHDIGFRKMVKRWTCTCNTLDALRTTLERRAQLGYRLETLHISACSALTGRDIRTLRPYVSNVEWDGYDLD